MEPITAHSDDELVEGKGIYKIKTLSYRSVNANRFFRRLDAVMLNAAQQNPLAKTSRRRIRRCPKKKPELSTYKLAPKCLPIDFYNPKWFHGLVHSQQHSIPDRTRIGFLPNANESLLPKPETHPDEKLADSTFTKKYWEIAVEPYGLLENNSPDDEADGSDQPDGSNDEGEGIDLTQPSPDASDSDSNYYQEGEGGDLEDEADEGFIARSSEEEGGCDSDDDDDNDDDDYDEADDGDYTMNEIPEGEEVW